MFNGAIGPKIVLTFTSLQYGEPAIVSGLTIVACIHPKGTFNTEQINSIL
jgi:hypothetical protein